MKLRWSYIVLYIILIWSFTNCKKIHVYPDTPEITFNDFTVTDTIDALDNRILQGSLSFDFVDGDGDIGLKDSDTTAPFDSTYYYNLYITEYYAQNDSFIQSEPIVPLNFRIPYVAATGQNKTLKGTVKISLIYNFPITKDSLYYSFYIYDRAFHKSNVEETSLIILPKN